MRLFSLGLLVAVVFSGCASVVSTPFTEDAPPDLEHVNHQLKDKVATIRFVDGNQVKGREVNVLSSAVFWTPVDGKDAEVMPLAEVEEIYYERPGRGLLIGAGVAIIIGLAIALTPSDADESGSYAEFGSAYAEAGKPLAIGVVAATALGISALANRPRCYVVYRRADAGQRAGDEVDP